MNIDSVRELKALVTADVAAPMAAVRRGVAGFGLAAQPVAALRGAVRTMAVGVVKKKGKQNFHVAVRLQRREMEGSPQLALLRKKAKREIDVRYVGRLVKRAVPWYQRRCRPLRIGCSIGHYQITAGTLGCFVRDRKTGTVLILSNNHVLANENAAAMGDDVIQPGDVDGGTRPADTIGALERFVKLKEVGANLVDAAVANFKKTIKYDGLTITGLGKLAGLGPDFLDEGTPVAKLGRTTGLTRGRVTAFELDNVVVAYDLGNLRFDNQIEIEGAGADPFSAGGDSGSLIVDDDIKAVALLFAGGDQGGTNGKGFTYANPIAQVLDRMKVDLL
jgi:hypothetical protein